MRKVRSVIALWSIIDGHEGLSAIIGVKPVCACVPQPVGSEQDIWSEAHASP
tara:strand:- start:191702 stop:191857 length:156 start_codon:yes stop_codon:yes gene_type:complete